MNTEHKIKSDTHIQMDILLICNYSSGSRTASTSSAPANLFHTQNETSTTHHQEHQEYVTLAVIEQRGHNGDSQNAGIWIVFPFYEQINRDNSK